MIRQFGAPVDLMAGVPQTGRTNLDPNIFHDALRQRLNPLSQMGDQANQNSAVEQGMRDQTAYNQQLAQRQAAYNGAVNAQYGAPASGGAAPSGAMGSWLDPIRGGKVSFGYGQAYASGGHAAGAIHRGDDIATPDGTPIYAPTAGTLVNFGADNSGFGNRLNAQFGANGPYGIFGHLSSYAPGLKAGQALTAGELLGYSGHSGDATGPHLHFELRKSLYDPSTSFDPTPYFRQMQW